MSGELELVWDGQRADLNFAGGDFVTGGGLESAILISIFSHARAPVELTPDLRPEQRGGWWAEDPAEPLGSLLWLTNRAKQTPETLARAREYVFNALAWLLANDIVQRYDVTTEYVSAGAMLITVTLARGDARRWSRAWNDALDTIYAAGNIRLQLATA